ncbi:MAG: bifunctional phosphoglucose/phosphomannose isomerase [Candidatus Woesearchaeota archaeon]
METVEEGIRKFSEHIEKASQIGMQLELNKNSINKIFVIGMGTSALAGEILKSYLLEIKSKIQVLIIRDYSAPEFVDAESLVFAISYSGNTEETISAFKQARVKAGKSVAITSGGKVEQECSEAKIPVIRIPQELNQQTALPYLFFPMLNTLISSGLVKGQIDYRGIIKSLRQVGMADRAEEFSEKLLSKTPIIYSSYRYYPAALRWKHSFNEIAKVHAFCNQFPEATHNEIMAFFKETDEFISVIISDESEFKRTEKHLQFAQEAMRKSCETTNLILKGRDYLTNTFSAVHLGDLTALFLAKKYNLDPDDSSIISEVKAKIKRSA